MNKFKVLGINDKTVKAITELGYEEPTPIQEAVIPIVLAGDTDLVGLAQTGTGKTAAFGLPLVNLIDFNSNQTQALILCPTRELCLQITRDLQGFSKFYEGAHIVAIYGGASIDTQIRDIKKGAQIIVATPGRMVDMLSRGRVNIKGIRWVVLDEADEMLNMGFKDDLDTILSDTPATKSTWLFSATMPNEVLRISKTYMNDPQEVTVGNKNEGAKNIEHKYYVVHARDRYAALKRVVDYYPEIFGIIFCRTRAETQEVADHLIRDGYNADSLHGDLSQAQRDLVMKRYRNRTLQLLVATDVAARGIDVNDVTHVINYNLPDEIENYTHRSGRTARAGKTGVSIVIVNMKEIGKIRVMERIIGKKFEHVNLPTGFEVCEKQLFHLVKKVHDVKVNEKEIEAYLPAIYEELKDVSREDLIKRFISEEFNRFLNYYKNAPDLNVDVKGERARSANSKRFFINVGRKDGFDAGTLKDYVAEITGVEKSAFIVDAKDSFSFFETDNKYSDQIMAAFNGQTYKGRNVNVEFSAGPSGGGEKRSYGRSGERGGFSGGRRSGGFGGGERRSGGYGEKRSGGYGERRSGGDGERKSYGDKRSGGYGERRSAGGDGERKSYGERRSSEGGERKSYGERAGGEERAKRPRKDTGEKRSFGGDRSDSGSERSGGNRSDRFKKRG